MWSPAADGNSTSAGLPFCNSEMSMTMYMDGFRSTLFAYLFDEMDDDDNNAPPCLNFLLKRWVLDSPAKFVGAMVFVVLLGITAEGMAAARSGGMIQKWAHQLSQRCCFGCCCCWSYCSTNSRFGDDGRSSAHRRRRQSSQCPRRMIVKMCIISTHMLQALVGYILMLAAMSYSLELLGSVLLGLGLGYATFFDLDYMYEGNGDDEVGREEEEEDQDDDPANVDGTTTTTTTTNPGSGNGRNGNPSGTSMSTCCDVAGRGPPRRRAFQFLRSPVPTLAGVGRSHRRMSPRDGGGTSDGNDGDADADEADAAMAVHGGRHGDGADNVSLHEDDKMTPLL